MHIRKDAFKKKLSNNYKILFYKKIISEFQSKIEKKFVSIYQMLFGKEKKMLLIFLMIIVLMKNKFHLGRV